MSSSRTLAQRAAAQPEPLARPAQVHARFIPGEELSAYAAWTPQLLGRAQAPKHTGFSDLSRQALGAGSMRHPVAGLPADQNFSHGLPPAALHGWSQGLTEAGALADDLAQAQARLPDGATRDTASLRDADTAWREAVREELQEELLAEWHAAAEAELAEQVQAARQTGYQDGYRDGLVALDSFKQSFAQQVTNQVGQLVLALDDELQALERQLAESVARVATALARQVVRTELALQPAVVAHVAQEAVAALVKNARHITIALHPDDQALVAQHCGEALDAAGARLVADSAVLRGGCLVESDMGSIDAQIGTRWQAAVQALGSDMPWQAPAAETAPPAGDAA